MNKREEKKEIRKKEKSKNDEIRKKQKKYVIPPAAPEPVFILTCGFSLNDATIITL